MAAVPWGANRVHRNGCGWNKLSNAKRGWSFLSTVDGKCLSLDNGREYLSSLDSMIHHGEPILGFSCAGRNIKKLFEPNGCPIL